LQIVQKDKNTREKCEGQLLGMRTALYYLVENEIVSAIDGMIEELHVRTDLENDLERAIHETINLRTLTVRKIPFRVLSPYGKYITLKAGDTVVPMAIRVNPVTLFGIWEANGNGFTIPNAGF